MQLETFTYDLGTKEWSVPALPGLDSPRTLVLAFGAPELVAHPNIFQILRHAYPSSHVIGCSSAGEIAAQEVRDQSLSVAVASFEQTTLSSTAVLIRDASSSFAAGQVLARRLLRPKLRTILVLSEGLKINGSELVRGLSSAVDESVVVTGGLAGDGTRFERTWVCCGNRLQSGLAAAIGLYGDHLIVGHGSQGGWDRFGPERVITRSAGNVLYELDGKPALDLYQQYLGAKAAELPSSGLLFPLSLRASATDTRVLVRAVLAVDRDTRSLTFAGDMPQGHLVQLMKADFERLVGGASGAARMAADVARGLDKSKSGILTIAISGVGRRIMLGDRIEEELDAVTQALPASARTAGFYSYGEISSPTAGHCDLHNQTMTVTVLAESAAMPAAAPGDGAVTMRVFADWSEGDGDASEPRADAPAPAQARIPAQGAAPPRPNGTARGKSQPEAISAAMPEAISAAPPAAMPPDLAVTGFLYDLDRGTWSVSSLPALDSAQTAVLVFGAPEAKDHPVVFEQLCRAYPRSHLIGCSGAGEIMGTEVRDRSLSVAVIRFVHTTLASTAVMVGSADGSFKAGQMLAKKLGRPDLRAILVLSEGIQINGSELVRGINSAVGESVVVTGGLAGDGTRFASTWIFCGDRLRSGVVAAVAFYGEHLIVGHGSRGGWDKFGPERVITRSASNVLYELDGKPALELYKQYLGEKAAELPASGLLFPLSLRSGPADQKSLVRTLLAVDESQKSMTFAGDMPEGSLVQLMKADFERLIGGASDAAIVATRIAREGGGRIGPHTLNIAISCVGRRVVLGDRIEEELDAVSEIMPEGVYTAGFYAYGEISPYATGDCELHNQTMTLTVLSESPVPLPEAVREGAGRAVDAATPLAPPAPRATTSPAPVTPPGDPRPPRPPARPATQPSQQSGAGAPASAPAGRDRPMISAAPPTRSRPMISAAPAATAGRSSASTRSRSSGQFTGSMPAPRAATSSTTARAVRDVVGEAPTMPVSIPFNPRAATEPPPSPRPPVLARAVRATGASRPRQTAPEPPPAPFEVVTLTYDLEAKRWSVPALPDLDSPRTLVLAFGAPAMIEHPPVFETLRKHYPESHIIGCSSAGEIAGAEVLDGALSVAIVRFAHTHLVTASVVVGDAAGSFPAGQVLAHKLNEPGLRAVIVLAEGVDVSGSELLRGINSVLGESVVVTGGLAGDGVRFERTWVLCGDKVQSGLVTAVGLYGSHLLVSHGAQGGWERLGPEFEVTRAIGNTVYELNDLPALTLYREYLGEHAAGLPATGLLFPLAVCERDGDKIERGSDKMLIRTVLAIDESQQSLTFAGDVPEGTHVLMMKASFERLIAGSAAAARMSWQDVGAGAAAKVLSIAVSCVGRRVVLGDRSDAEVAALLTELPRGACSVGFYAYGQICPFSTGHSDLHNQTMTVTVLAESATPVTREASAALIRHAQRIVAAGDFATGTAMRQAEPSAVARAATPISRPSAIPPLGDRSPMALMPSADLSAHHRTVGGVHVFELVGRMNESFEGRKLARELAGVVVFDLGQVDRVTSFGVREWLQMLDAAPPGMHGMYLARCSEPVVNQLSMIRGFAGSGSVVSFVAPYGCSSCGHAFERLIDCEHDAQAIRTATAPEAQCPRCHQPGFFDDDIKGYMAFALPYAGKPVPAEVRAAMAGSAHRSGHRINAIEGIEKSIHDQHTRIRVNTTLDESVRWSRILEGVEGVVRLDLGGVAEVTPTGLSLLEAALRSMSATTERCEIENCPAKVADHLAAARPRVSAAVLSAYVTGSCQRCRLPRIVLLDVVASRDILAHGGDPSVLCRRCNSLLSFTGARAVLTFLGRGLEPHLASPVLPPRPRRTSMFPIIAAVAAVMAFGGGLLIATQRGNRGGARTSGAASGQEAARGAVPGPAGDGASGSVSGQLPGQLSGPAGSPASAQPVLPPAWADHPFVIQGEHIFLVGQADTAAGAEQAVEAARAQAVLHLLDNLVPELVGSPLYDYLRGEGIYGPHGRLGAIAGLTGPDLELVVTRFMTGAGRSLIFERVDVHTRPGHPMWVRFRLPASALSALAQHYRQSSAVFGTTVGPAFPVLASAGTQQGDLLVVRIEPESPGQLAGLVPGDQILRVDGRFISSVQDYDAAVERAWRKLRRGKSLTIELADKRVVDVEKTGR